MLQSTSVLALKNLEMRRQPLFTDVYTGRQDYEGASERKRKEFSDSVNFGESSSSGREMGSLRILCVG